MATDDERERIEETPSVDSTAKPRREATASEVAGGAEDGFAEAGGSEALVQSDDGGDELEIDDRAALDRATDLVSDAELDTDDDQVEEPTVEELIALRQPVDRSDSDDDADAARADEIGPDEVGSDEIGPDEVGSDEVGGDRELVGVGAGAAGAKAKSGKQATKKKGRATPKRDSGSTAHQRTGPVTFVKESVGELRKVVYPTGPQLLNYFVVVLIFVLFIIAIVSVLDLAFGWAILKIFS